MTKRRYLEIDPRLEHLNSLRINQTSGTIDSMTKPATPMTQALALHLVGRSLEEILRRAWDHARKLESDRARLIEALRTLTRECEEYSAMCQEDPAPSRKQARSLLRELEGK